ncbi:cytochrome C biogenesis protein [Carbonactinospora thermoautotrophica]|uniref:Cytochrome C biogenesis protein n=3 Tax=Carbonactinospora thermoautotrophica TaxID=1469144 RepID=A0A132MJW9_9ACTN|nr:cytochrome C biogenesis protein [Carbonactinospora thermoautotrophica]
MINQGLAQLSDMFMYSAIAVYAMAFLATAAEWVVDARRARRAAVPAGVAAGTGAEAGGVATLVRPAPAPGGEYQVERWGRIGVSLTVLAFLLHLAAVACRGFSAQRMPWGNMYEFSTGGGLAVTGVYLFLLARYKVRWLGLFVLPLVLGTLLLAVTVLYVDSGELLPALKSYWLAVHVTAAVISSGLFTIGAVASVLYLLRSRHDARVAAGAAPGGFWGRLPDAARLDKLAYRVHAVVFPLWTFAIVAGAVWAEAAWGRYWGWDPKEVWSFVTWVVYAAYLHARATVGWKERAAVIALVGYGTFLFNYFGVNILFSGLHSYSGL